MEFFPVPVISKKRFGNKKALGSQGMPDNSPRGEVFGIKQKWPWHGRQHRPQLAMHLPLTSRWSSATLGSPVPSRPLPGGRTGNSIFRKALKTARLRQAEEAAQNRRQEWPEQRLGGGTGSEGAARAGGLLLKWTPAPRAAGVPGAPCPALAVLRLSLRRCQLAKEKRDRRGCRGACFNTRTPAARGLSHSWQ